MRASIACVALMAALLAGTQVFAQAVPPIPPPREHPVGEAPLEQHPSPITAEPPATETPSLDPHPAEPAPPTAMPDEPRLPAVEPVRDIPLPPTEPTPATGVEPVREAAPLEIAPDQQVPAPVEVAPAKAPRSTAGEVQLVERNAVAREAYRLSLEALKSHYVDTHNAVKLERVEKELSDLNGVEMYNYLDEVGLAPPTLKPSASIPAADQLYAEGMAFKDYPAFPDEKRGKLKVALQKFRAIISNYPTSDKIDDAAYRMGEIYEGWYYNDFAQAVVCFERCFEWNPKTPFPAYYKAAKLYDQKLMMRDKAVELYRKVINANLDQAHVQEALRRIRELGVNPS